MSSPRKWIKTEFCKFIFYKVRQTALQLLDHMLFNAKFSAHQHIQTIFLTFVMFNLDWFTSRFCCLHLCFYSSRELQALKLHKCFLTYLFSNNFIAAEQTRTASLNLPRNQKSSALHFWSTTPAPRLQSAWLLKLQTLRDSFSERYLCVLGTEGSCVPLTWLPTLPVPDLISLTSSVQDCLFHCLPVSGN